MVLYGIEAETWVGISLLLAFEVVGILHVLHALMNVRTSQGTIAWVISLVVVPYLAIPLYWLLGRTRFSVNVGGRRRNDERLAKKAAAKLAAVNAENPNSEEAIKEQERKRAIIAAAIARAQQQK